MIEIENFDVMGWEAAIRGMRNPMNSWEKSDSDFGSDFAKEMSVESEYHIGPSDFDLMTRLCNAGTDHRKFMRMITVYVDITAPLYWWKEFDTYKVGTVANSCSTMHKIADKEFTLDDFSHEHLRVNIPAEKNDGDESYQNLWFKTLKEVIRNLNIARGYYIREKDAELKKAYWWQMIQLLPSSYNQRRTVMLNYEVLANIYPSRKNHKLDEWKEFCSWVESLPYSELITGKFDEKGKQIKEAQMQSNYVSYAYLCNTQQCVDCSFPECSHTTDKRYRLISKEPTEMRLIGFSNGVKYYMEYIIKEDK